MMTDIGDELPEHWQPIKRHDDDVTWEQNVKEGLVKLHNAIEESRGGNDMIEDAWDDFKVKEEMLDKNKDLSYDGEEPGVYIMQHKQCEPIIVKISDSTK